MIQKFLENLSNPYRLTPTEYRIFALLQDGDRYYRSDEIFAHAFKNAPSNNNTLRVHIYSLRKKIQPNYKIIPGYGYAKGSYKLQRIMPGISAYARSYTGIDHKEPTMETNDQIIDELFDKQLPKPLSEEQKYDENLKQLDKTQQDLLHMVDIAIQELYSYKRDTQAECLLNAKEAYVKARGV